MRRRPRARLSWLSQPSLRRWPLWLVTAALLAGTLPLHSDLERHGALDGATHVWLEQCPPGTARHLEPSARVELPRCVACLLQLQSKGEVVAAPRQVAGLARVGTVDRALQRALASAPQGFPASRGPPRA